MNKKVKIILAFVLVEITVLGLIFFIVDYNRTKKQELPVFCILTGIYQDGGTTVYMGLGYKVIAFYEFDSNEDTGYYDKIHIGTWFMTFESAHKRDSIDSVKEMKTEELKRQFTILKDLEKNDETGKYNYYVIDQYYNKPIVIKVENKYNLKENVTYEFTFKGKTTVRIGYDVSKIFDNFQITNITEINNTRDSGITNTTLNVKTD